MIEKFHIRISTFEAVGGVHYYGHVDIPQARQDWSQPSFQYYHELDRETSKSNFRTIRFGTIRQIIAEAKIWFLSDPRVKPGDKLTIWKGYWKERDTRID